MNGLDDISWNHLSTVQNILVQPCSQGIFTVADRLSDHQEWQRMRLGTKFQSCVPWWITSGCWRKYRPEETLSGREKSLLKAFNCAIKTVVSLYANIHMLYHPWCNWSNWQWRECFYGLVSSVNPHKWRTS